VLFYRRSAPQILSLRYATPVQWLVVVLAVLPLSVVASEVSNWVGWLLPGLSITNSIFSQLSKETLAGALIFGSAIAAVGEELCFRGFVGRGLVARYGPLRGVLITSLLFGLVHLEPVQASGAVILGLALHAVYLSTRSLWASIALHGFNNAMAFV